MVAYLALVACSIDATASVNVDLPPGCIVHVYDEILLSVRK